VGDDFIIDGWLATDGAHPQRGGRLHPGMPGAGGRHQPGSGRVIRVLERLIAERGAPESVRSDNGPEFTSRRMIGWAEKHKITLIHIQPANPCRTDIGSFHGRLRMNA